MEVSWDELEQWCAQRQDLLPNSVPSDARQWQAFRKQFMELQDVMGNPSQEYLGSSASKWYSEMLRNYKNSRRMALFNIPIT